MATQDKSSTASQLKLCALEFLSAALAISAPSVFAPHAEALAPSVFEAVAERYYKVSAEALRVCKNLLRVVRPDPRQPLASQHEVRMLGAAMRMIACREGAMCDGWCKHMSHCHTQSLVRQLVACLLPRVQAPDVDQEIKEAAIACAAAAVALACDVVPEDSRTLLAILCERLRNETTRMAAVRALSVVATSPLRPDLTPVLQGAMEELTGFLRKASRQIKHASLETLEAWLGLRALVFLDTSHALKMLK